MFIIAFVIMAVLHFGGIVALPLWLVFLPLVAWIAVILGLLGLAWWANS